MVSVNITVAMPPEMVDKIDAARGTVSRARYIRKCIRMADGSPFEVPEDGLPDFSDLDTESATAGGSA